MGHIFSGLNWKMAVAFVVLQVVDKKFGVSDKIAARLA